MVVQSTADPRGAVRPAAEVVELARPVVGAVIVCGDGPRESRGDCPDPLHDYPLPSGYTAAGEVAARRLRKGWANLRCRICGLYGWTPGNPTGDGYDDRAPYVPDYAKPEPEETE